MPNQPILIRCGSCRTLNRVPGDKLSSNPVCGQCKTPLDFPRFPINGTAAGFQHDVYEWPEYVLVEFWAKWCGYCRVIEPVVNDLANWRAGRLKVIRVDVDAEPSLGKQFTVKATPTFILFKNGRQVARMDGAPKEKIQLVQWLDQLMR